MADQKVEKLKKLLELLKEDTITPAQLKDSVMLMVSLVKKGQEDAQNLSRNIISEESKKSLDQALANLEARNKELLGGVEKQTKEQLAQLNKKTQETLNKALLALEEIKAIEVVDGKDADEEVIVKKVLGRIEFPTPEPEPEETPEQIVGKLNTLKSALDWKVIKNAPKAQIINNITEQRGGGFIETPIKAGSNITVTKDASGSWVIAGSAGGGGTWGSITGTLSSQTDLQNALNAKAATLSGTINQIAYFDSSSTIASLAVATYPSLTEISYVKGVTSAIQTQLNAKGAGTVTSIGVTTANGVSGTSSGGATPNLTITLGAITPTSTNGVSAATMAFMDATSSVQTQLNAKGAGTVTSVTGTTNRITSSGGATPAIDISASYVGQSSITTLGTITTGIWNGTLINQAYLGTGGGGSTKFLREDNTWQTVAGGGTGIVRSVASIAVNTAAGSAATTDYVYKCTATLTLTLPTAVGNTNLYTVKNTAGTTTIATTSAQTIDGSSTATLSVANTSLSLISDGTNWLVV